MKKILIRLRNRQRHILCLYTFVVTTAGLLVTDTVLAAQNYTPPRTELDVEFVVRTLLAILLAIIAYYTRAIEKRVEDLEKRERENAIIISNVKTQENRIVLMEHETKQLGSQIGLIREGLYKDYHNKQEIDKRWEHIEDSLRGIRNRLDIMARPLHRRSDDDSEEGAGGRR